MVAPVVVSLIVTLWSEENDPAAGEKVGAAAAVCVVMVYVAVATRLLV